MMAIGITSPLITLYFEELGANYGLISIILTTVGAMALLGNYAWGYLSDRLGRRKPLLLAGLIGAAIAFVLLGMAPNASVAWAIRLGSSLFAAAFSTLSLALMGDVLEDDSPSDGSNRRGRNMGLYRGLGSAAFALGAVIGGPLADAYSLNIIFYVCAGIYLIAIVFTLMLKEVPVQPAPETAVTEQSLPAALSPQLPYLFLSGVLLWTMAHSASASMWPNFMNSLGYSKTAISSLWGLAALVELPAMYLTGALSDITGRAIMLAAGGAGITLVNLGYASIAAWMPALLAIQVVRGFGYGSYTASAMTFTAEFGSQQTRGRASGLFGATGSAGQLLGAYMGGTLVQARGFEFMFIFCAVSAFCSALCFLALRRQTLRAAPASPLLS